MELGITDFHVHVCGGKFRFGIRISAGLREHQDDIRELDTWVASSAPYTRATLAPLASTSKSLGLKLNYESTPATLMKRQTKEKSKWGDVKS
ncbi:MAG: hypothetical protein KIH01_01000 [Candidatus Freyarchaeota archaeon]|nr:hypothetical protein [Candidatus Jordarchaeia archaeon]